MSSRKNEVGGDENSAPPDCPPREFLVFRDEGSDVSVQLFSHLLCSYFDQFLIISLDVCLVLIALDDDLLVGFLGGWLG